VNDGQQKNSIYPWLRLMLWILPAGFTVLSAMAIGTAGDFLHVTSFRLSMFVWILINVLFIIGTGWCDYQLSLPDRKQRSGVVHATALFFLCQVFVAPLILAVVGVAACAFVF
jgi:hypothetical protein